MSVHAPPDEVVNSSENRSIVPAELRRRILVESGHRCAIPTCRYIEVEVHHIVPWATCQVHEYDNLIALCPNCHKRADRGEIDRKALRLYKMNLRFMHDKFERVEIDLLFELSRLNRGVGIMWPPANLFFIRRIVEAGYVVVEEPTAGQVLVNGMQISPRLVIVTEKGREFLREIGATEF